MNITDLESIGRSKFAFYRIKFTIFLLLQISSIMVTILIFFHLTKHRTFIKAPQKHGLFILLIINSVQLVFDIPLSRNFYVSGYVNPPVASHCIWWTFFEYIIYVSSEYLLAIISLQRHIFIFHQHILRKRWICHLLHHLPLLFCIIYPTVFYIYAILLYPCNNTQWDFSSRVCGFANCYLMYGSFLGSFDLVMNNGVPVAIDILANTVLIARVFLQKRRVQQLSRWRQQRRMLRQLLSVSALYLVGWTPFLLVYIINVLVDPAFLNYVQQNYFSDLIYIIYFFFPWVWLGFFPELTRRIVRKCCRQRTDNAIDNNVSEEQSSQLCKKSELSHDETEASNDHRSKKHKKAGSLDDIESETIRKNKLGEVHRKIEEMNALMRDDENADIGKITGVLENLRKIISEYQETLKIKVREIEQCKKPLSTEYMTLIEKITQLLRHEYADQSVERIDKLSADVELFKQQIVTLKTANKFLRVWVWRRL
ncbi:unnamed protein product [Adineta ricciae]|uniref:G-protein coupled receptors family 1 profile domain-containing protein n=1 Tax=Adineta ricciae TaxID=249248 RepID=A0A815ND58_ADIRI|nr:unnamed protein product [Adineta ricciae]